jgi:Icc-related predicted phosphoesterase
MRLSEELDSKWKAIPNNTEVLITHGPAHGKVGGNCVDGFDAGCELLTKRILEFNPLIHVRVIVWLVCLLLYLKSFRFAGTYTRGG